jgi:hypothetical protein
MKAPINLNQARKERTRANKKGQADENAARYGQSKAQKEALKARAALIKRNLEAHKRET